MKYRVLPLAGIYILLLIIIPSVIIGIGSISMSIGIGIIVFISIYLELPYLKEFITHTKLGRILLCIILLIIYILITGFISIISDPDFNTYKFYESILLLICCFFGAISGVSVINRIESIRFDYSLKYCFYVFYVTGFISLIGYSPFHHGLKPIIFFSEPSFYAINIAPFLLYVVIIYKFKIKIFILSSVIILALLLQSLTLLITVLFCSIIVFNFSRKFIIFLLISSILLILFSGAIDFTYYSNRLNLQTDNNNISSLAYLSGLERVLIVFKEHRWIGLGFQQLGFIGDQGEILSKLDYVGVPDLNLTDGSFVAAKLISEFGIFACALIFIYVKKFYKIYISIRAQVIKGVIHENYKTVFFKCCYMMYAVDLFCRGTGYFTPTGFLFLMSLLWFALYNSVEKNK